MVAARCAGLCRPRKSEKSPISTGHEGILPKVTCRVSIVFAGGQKSVSKVRASSSRTPLNMVYILF